MLHAEKGEALGFSVFIITNGLEASHQLHIFKILAFFKYNTHENNMSSDERDDDIEKVVRVRGPSIAYEAKTTVHSEESFKLLNEENNLLHLMKRERSKIKLLCISKLFINLPTKASSFYPIRTCETLPY